MKNAFDGLIIRLHIAKEGINEFEGLSNDCNTLITGIPEREERGTDEIFEVKMAEIFPKIMKDTTP